MKKLVIAIAVIALIILGIVWIGRSPSNNPSNGSNASSTNQTGSSTPSVPVSKTTKVSGQTSEYKNSELGFLVKYPTAWEKAEADLGVSFIIPIDKTQVSTIAKLQGDINVFSSKCAFPPVTTIKDRGTLKVGTLTMNTISMSNTVQGRAYFNRMYSLQKDSICYMFTFSSITKDPASVGLKGSNITQAQNNNKAIVTSADAAFTEMVKTFAFVVGPQGIDETKAPK
ncbi:MAG: hypothetical protein AAB470_03305 [Patescibacteria group bacterium]